ncbi:MAG: chemotaxis protein CheW [Chloroflexota bacterium]
MGSPDGFNGKNSSPVIGANERYHLVTFRLDRQVYALPIEPIRQIIEMVTITPIPQVSSLIEGVINVRGTAIPVVNLRHHLGIARIPLQLHTPIILVNASGRLVGLIVDEVMDVFDCQANAVVHPRDILPDGIGETPLLSGLIRAEENVIMLLDADHLFHAVHVQALAQAATSISDDLFADAEEPVAPPQTSQATPADPKPRAKSRRKAAPKKTPQAAEGPEPADEGEKA